MSNYWRTFQGPNAGYILELYDRYREHPESLDAQTRAFFERYPPPANGAAPAAGAPPTSLDIQAITGAANLAQAIRANGHLAAPLDPLGSEPPGDPLFEPETHVVTEEMLRQMPASLVGGPVTDTADNAWEAIQRLRDVYSSTIGYDYDHITIPEERDWLRNAAETRRFQASEDPEALRGILERLTQVEVFEQFLQRVFPGKHRFSIEGLDVMVPMLDEIVCAAGNDGIGRMTIGMAHRGRLNILAHVLKKPYAQILAEFKDPVDGRVFRDDLGWTGDVKYHKGAYHAAPGSDPCDVTLTMPPNPSHLEAINPVICGMARAAGTWTGRAGAPSFDPDVTLPILIHGDAAFPGQGVVAETFNMSQLPGYWVGGTVHIIANNQLGYTTVPTDARSTRHASTLAKGFKVPIVHVNADDPLACLEAARLATAYRQHFKKDFVINLIGYRRHGHNEGDEPSFTQPLMYDIIRQHPTVRALWAQLLEARGVIEPGDADEIYRQQMERLQQAYDVLKPEEDLNEELPTSAPKGIARRMMTAVPLEALQTLNEALLSVPEGFHLHRKLERPRERRREALRDPAAASIDWATAEELAMATILADGIPIRLTGQDTERGTFNQRHAVFHDVETGATYVPLQGIPQAKASFEIHNSPLTEGAVVGFEYGYSIEQPTTLVLWEAQYGDFVNGAQVMIDEFVVAARAKWGQIPSLVMLLPHGYEGAGPDHSSARLERFLTLTGETNMRIANCTTAAQYFHLLRRQAHLLTGDPLPLIVMTPKSLLRHPLVASSLQELAEGHWQPVIDDAEAAQRADEVRRLFVCSGKVYVDLISQEQRQQHPEVAIIRLEQLYPFPEGDLNDVLSRYPHAEELVWVQEEPENMGAWWYLLPRLQRLADGRWPVRYVGRAASSSPAEGSAAWHTANQEKLLQQAYDPGPDPIADDFVIS